MTRRRSHESTKRVPKGQGLILEEEEGTSEAPPYPAPWLLCDPSHAEIVPSIRISFIQLDGPHETVPLAVMPGCLSFSGVSKG